MALVKILVEVDIPDEEWCDPEYGVDPLADEEILQVFRNEFDGGSWEVVSAVVQPPLP